MTAHIDQSIFNAAEVNLASARGALKGQIELVLWELERDDMFPPQCSPRNMQELRRCLNAVRDAENAMHADLDTRLAAASREVAVALLMDTTEQLLENHRRAVGGQELG